MLFAALATVSIATTRTQNVATSSEPVPPVAPTANAGPDQTVSLRSTAWLDGSKSSDPDGHKLTYAWSIVDKPASSKAKVTNPTSVQPAFVPDRMGTYKIQLVVNDGTKKSAPDTVTITMHPTKPSL
ncbi:MAG: PKD domain-containing protein [Halobacteriota archaeon]